MEIKLTVSKEKNLEKLNKLTDDPAFIVSILKNMGFSKCPNCIEVKIGLIKPKNKDKDEEKTENECHLAILMTSKIYG